MNALQLAQSFIIFIFIIFCIFLYFAAKKKMKTTKDKSEIDMAKLEIKISLIVGISFLIIFFISFFI